MFTNFYLSNTNRVNVFTTFDDGNAISLEDISLFEETHVNNPCEDIIKGIDDKINEEVSEVGMTFDNVDQLKQFYRTYAIKCGFGVRIRSSSKGEDNELCFIRLVCSREGKCHTAIPSEVKSFPSQRKECPARISGVKKEGQWYIRHVNNVHNHDLSPKKSRLIRGNKKITMQVKRTLHMNDEAGVRINKSFQSLVCEAGGFENVPFVERDVRNYIGKQRRRLCKDGDAQALITHFSNMQQLNNDFYYDIDLDSDDRISNVFWVDARSRAACQEFGDVISFDTTYLTNKYDMPFAPFVGINHHGQSILLGCGLLSSEDTSTFVWLFQSWRRCMSNRSPEGIVTDQCKAMQNAIEIVFPHTRHRWCLWHIMKKIPEKLQGYSQYKRIKCELKKLVYESVNVLDFESGWSEFLMKYELQNNEWLGTLYEDKYRWVPAYLKSNFWAGMSTTQRSEGLNAFFDGFINSTTTLHHFVVQYNNALKHKAEKKCEADFASMNTIIPCATHSLIERQFQENYTNAKFEKIQKEFRSKMNCVIKNVHVDDFVSNYVVLQECLWDGHRENKYHKVIYNSHTQTITCTCLLFEFRGILCRHCLVVLAQEEVKTVHSRYIIPRWSKLIRRRYSSMRAAYNSKSDDPQMVRYQALCKEFFELADVTCETESATEILFNQLKSLRNSSSHCSGVMQIQINCPTSGGQINGNHHFPQNAPPPTTQTTLRNSAIRFHCDPQHQPLWNDSFFGKTKPCD